MNYLYSDLSDGLIIFQLYDIIQAGTVDWSRVNQKFAKIRAFMQKIGALKTAFVIKEKKEKKEKKKKKED